MLHQFSFARFTGSEELVAERGGAKKVQGQQGEAEQRVETTDR